MRVTIASGKGGTGKTTLSTNLALTAARMGVHTTYADCDVEEPNGHLFLPGDVENATAVKLPMPVIDEELCDNCGLCSEFCQFNALVSLKQKTLLFSELCHACGGCRLVCPQRAIREQDQVMGTVESWHFGSLRVLQGRVNIGVSSVSPVISAVKQQLESDGLAIVDAPPGTACPVVETLQGSDFVLLVTEPTPFGLHDLKLSVELLRTLDLPFEVMVNRAGSGDDRVERYCLDEGIPLALSLPDDRRVAQAYSRGERIVEALPEYNPLFEDLIARLLRLPSRTPVSPTSAGEAGV